MYVHESSNKRKFEDFQEFAAGTDDLLILKRVGEIQEAPESQAKKKHEARMLVKKMQQIESHKKTQYIKIRNSLTFQDNKDLKLQDYTQTQLQAISELGADKKQERPQKQVRKVRVLTRKELNEMSESCQVQFKNIRILSKSKLNKIQLKKQIKLQSEIWTHTPENLSAQMKRVKKLSTQVNKSSDHFPLNFQKTQELQGSPRYERQVGPKNKANFSVDDILMPNQVDPERSKKFKKLMNDTIAQFNHAIKHLDTAILQKYHVSKVYYLCFNF